MNHNSCRVLKKKSQMKKKLLAVTGIRSEYDILFPVIDCLRRDPGFDVKLVVCGAHLSEWHGKTIQKIEKDKFTIADRIDSLFMTDRDTQRAKAVGTLICGLCQTIEREAPDFVLVVGDREESIATAIVGNYMRVLVAHIGGGDPVFGHDDDPVRFAVSKLAHIHLAMSEQSAANLRRIGEENFRVFNAGNPSLDNIRSTPPVPIEKLSKAVDFDISKGNYIVLIKHPLSSQKQRTYSQMQTTLRTLERFCAETDFKVIGIYPNTDPGAYGIIKAIEEYADKPFISFSPTLPRDIFINLVRNARCLVGNSSMGILEAPFYKLPVVNIGNRQRGRLNAGNVEFVAHQPGKIKAALQKACFDKNYRKAVRGIKNPYGDGKTAQRIRKILLAIKPDENKWHVKKRLC